MQVSRRNEKTPGTKNIPARQVIMSCFERTQIQLQHLTYSVLTYLIPPLLPIDPLILSLTSSTSIPQLPPNMAHEPFEYAPIPATNPLEADLDFGNDICLGFSHRLLLAYDSSAIIMLRYFVDHKHPTYKDGRLGLRRRYW